MLGTDRSLSPSQETPTDAASGGDDEYDDDDVLWELLDLEEIAARTKEARECQEQLAERGNAWLRKLELQIEVLKDEGSPWEEVKEAQAKLRQVQEKVNIEVRASLARVAIAEGHLKEELLKMRASAEEADSQADQLSTGISQSNPDTDPALIENARKAVSQVRQQAAEMRRKADRVAANMGVAASLLAKEAKRGDKGVRFADEASSVDGSEASTVETASSLPKSLMTGSSSSTARKRYKMRSKAPKITAPSVAQKQEKQDRTESRKKRVVCKEAADFCNTLRAEWAELPCSRRRRAEVEEILRCMEEHLREGVATASHCTKVAQRLRSEERRNREQKSLALADLSYFAHRAPLWLGLNRWKSQAREPRDQSIAVRHFAEALWLLELDIAVGSWYDRSMGAADEGGARGRGERGRRGGWASEWGREPDTAQIARGDQSAKLAARVARVQGLLGLAEALSRRPTRLALRLWSNQAGIPDRRRRAVEAASQRAEAERKIQLAAEAHRLKRDAERRRREEEDAEERREASRVEAVCHMASLRWGFVARPVVVRWRREVRKYRSGKDRPKRDIARILQAGWRPQPQEQQQEAPQREEEEATEAGRSESVAPSTHRSYHSAISAASVESARTAKSAKSQRSQQSAVSGVSSTVSSRKRRSQGKPQDEVKSRMDAVMSALLDAPPTEAECAFFADRAGIGAAALLDPGGQALRSLSRPGVLGMLPQGAHRSQSRESGRWATSSERSPPGGVPPMRSKTSMGEHRRNESESEARSGSSASSSRAPSSRRPPMSPGLNRALAADAKAAAASEKARERAAQIERDQERGLLDMAQMLVNVEGKVGRKGKAKKVRKEKVKIAIDYLKQQGGAGAL